MPAAHIYLKVTAVEWFAHSVSLPGSVHITLDLLDPIFFFSSSTFIKHTSGTQREHQLLCCLKWIRKREDAPFPSQTDQRSVAINQIFKNCLHLTESVLKTETCVEQK